MDRIRVRFYCQDRQFAASFARELSGIGWEINEDEAGRCEVVVDLNPTEGKSLCGLLEELARDATPCIDE